VAQPGSKHARAVTCSAMVSASYSIVRLYGSVTAGMSGRPDIVLATSQDAICLITREFKTLVDDVVGNVCPAPPARRRPPHPPAR